jgi:phosphatidylglycerophosphate synthase
MIEFARWSRGNALAVVLTTLLVAGSRLPALLAAVAAVSFGLLLRQTRGGWTAAGVFGLANLITSVRLLLTLGLLLGGLALSDWWIVLLAASVVTLDGVDGWAARRFEIQGEFGARYDTAVDSLFTLGLSCLLLCRGVLGGWVLLAGLWHYVYVLSVLIFPSEREAKRSLLGASVFVALVSTMGAAFVLPPAWAAGLVGAAVILQSASFVWSFWQRYGAA